jgi:hypothetical protein
VQCSWRKSSQSDSESVEGSQRAGVFLSRLRRAISLVTIHRSVYGFLHFAAAEVSFASGVVSLDLVEDRARNRPRSDQGFGR